MADQKQTISDFQLYDDIADLCDQLACTTYRDNHSSLAAEGLEFNSNQAPARLISVWADQN